MDIRTATVHDGDESFVNLILVFGVSMGQGLEQSHSRLSVLHAGGLGQTLCDHLDTCETDRQLKILFQFTSVLEGPVKLTSTFTDKLFIFASSVRDGEKKTKSVFFVLLFVVRVAQYVQQGEDAAILQELHQKLITSHTGESKC